jgi:uncharacterized protein (UPF0548 family)
MNAARRAHPLPSVDTALTYPQVGATKATLPPGYRHVRLHMTVGTGPSDFRAAVDLLMTWEMHRRAGLSVEASSPRVAVGEVVRLGFRLGPTTVLAPCRIVSVVDEPRRRGFTYGTLPGHPERGEESFVVSLLDNQSVEFTVVAFSRPALWWSRAGAPVNRWVQRRITARYVAALKPG